MEVEKERDTERYTHKDGERGTREGESKTERERGGERDREGQRETERGRDTHKDGEREREGGGR